MTSHPLNLISAVISSEKSFLPTLDSHLHPSCPVSTPCFLPKSSLRFSHLSIDLHCFFLLQREGSQGLVPYHLHGTLIHHNAWCTVGQLHFWLGGWMQRKKEQITILCENLKPGKEKGAWEKNGHCFKFNCIPPKLYFEVLTLLPVKVTLSESMVSQMESSSHEVIRMGPNPIGSLSSLGEKKKSGCRQREEIATGWHRNRGKTIMWREGQRLEWGCHKPLLEPSEGAWFCS